MHLLSSWLAWTLLSCASISNLWPVVSSSPLAMIKDITSPIPSTLWIRYYSEAKPTSLRREYQNIQKQVSISTTQSSAKTSIWHLYHCQQYQYPSCARSFSNRFFLLFSTLLHFRSTNSRKRSISSMFSDPLTFSNSPLESGSSLRRLLVNLIAPFFSLSLSTPTVSFSCSDFSFRNFSIR